MLQYFDPNLPIKLSIDASKSGLGALLLQLHEQGWHPVAFASLSLSPNLSSDMLKLKKTHSVCLLELKDLMTMFMAHSFLFNQTINRPDLLSRRPSMLHHHAFKACYLGCRNTIFTLPLRLVHPYQSLMHYRQPVYQQ